MNAEQGGKRQAGMKDPGKPHVNWLNCGLRVPGPGCASWLFKKLARI